MKAFISCNDQSITTTLRAGLTRVGVDCPSQRILSHESALLLMSHKSVMLFGAQDGAANAPVIFFGSQTLAVEELLMLKQICAGANKIAKVILVGANLSPAMILQAIRMGAADCVDLATNFDAELQEVLRRVNTVSQGSGEAGKLYAVLGAGGGVGASLVAVNLAADFSQRGHRTALLDLHIRGGDIATLLKCAPRHTLASLAAKKDQVDLAMFEQALVKHECGVNVLASPEPFTDFRFIRPELIFKVVCLARDVFTHTVADLEDCEHDEQVRVLANCDRAILVMRPDFVSLHRAKKCLEFLTRAKVPREHLTLVANRLGTPKALNKQLIEEALGMHVEHEIPEEAEAVNSSVNLGTPLVFTSPSAKVSRGIAHLANSLVGVSTDSTDKSWTKRQINRLKSVLSANPTVPEFCAVDNPTT